MWRVAASNGGRRRRGASLQALQTFAGNPRVTADRLDNRRASPASRGCLPAEPQRAVGVSIIVPRYQEVADVRPLAGRVANVMAGRTWELLFVDDDSQHGCDHAVVLLAHSLPVRAEARPGVGRARSLCILHGLKCARHDRLVVMDADLSHPPEGIPKLLAALDGGAEMAIGSRRAPGGERCVTRNTWRRLSASLPTFLAKPLVTCSDPMSGFFALDRVSLPAFGLLRPVGSMIALELMVRGRLRVAAVPIGFPYRETDRGKQDWRRQFAFVRHLHRLYLWRFRRSTRIASFLAVGATSFVIDLAVYLGLQGLGVEHRLARFCSFWPAVTWGWWLNRQFTFADRPRAPPAQQWSRFAAGSVVGLIVNVGCYATLTTFVAALDERRFAALVIGIALASAVNYSAATLYAYRRRSPETHA